MRELERTVADTSLTEPAQGLRRIAIVGRGRVGRTLATALSAAGYEVDPPVGRGEAPVGDAVLLCVPDSEIAAAAAVAAGCAPLVGHTSGATPLSALEPAARAGAELFALHPLQTIPDEGAALAGCGCAVAGSSPAALDAARELAAAIGMVAFEIADGRRPAYHAAASIASNYLITLEAAAETMAAAAGLEPADARRLLGPLVESTVANWLELGPRRALTGPVARGDEATVAAQRSAVAAAAPELVPLFDVLAERTRALAGEPA